MLLIKIKLEIIYYVLFLSGQTSKIKIVKKFNVTNNTAPIHTVQIEKNYKRLGC